MTGSVKCHCDADAGMIGVADFDFYPVPDQTIDKYTRDGLIVMIQPGKYEIRIDADFEDSSNVSKTSTLNIKSGKLVIGDPCYGFSGLRDQWSKVLNDYDYFKRNDEKIMTIDTYGDGDFDVQVTWKKV